MLVRARNSKETSRSFPPFRTPVMSGDWKIGDWEIGRLDRSSPEPNTGRSFNGFWATHSNSIPLKVAAP